MSLDHRRVEYAESLVPLAAELVGCVRDYGTDEVRAVLARVPHGNLDDLAVVLAAMVDPDARPADLLAWTVDGPVTSRPGFDLGRRLTVCPDCGEVLQESSLARHTSRLHDEQARLLDAGVSPAVAAVLAPRQVA